MTDPERGKVFGLVDQVLDFGRDIEDAEARLQRVDRLVNVLSNPARIEEGLFLRPAEEWRSMPQVHEMGGLVENGPFLRRRRRSSGRRGRVRRCGV